jgi:outer membrane biosynthesis protein TonB
MREKLANIEERYNEIISKYSDLDEVGFDELSSTWKEIDELKNEANAIGTDMLVGITRDGGKFKSKDSVEFSFADIAEITGIIDKFTDRVYNDIKRINSEERAKKDQFTADYRERNRVRFDIRNTRNMIASLEAENKAINIELGNPSQELLNELAKAGIPYTPSTTNVSPDRRFFLEQRLAANEASLKNYKDALDTYAVDEQRLTDEMEVLKHGGKLPNVAELNKTDDMEQEINKPLEETSTNDLNNSIVTPVPSDVTPVQTEPEKTDDDLIDIGAPIAPVDDELTNSEDENKENEDGLGVVPVPVGVPTDEDDLLAGIGEPLDEPEQEDLTEFGEELETPEEEVEDEREKVEEVVDAKPTLLSKWDKIVFAAIGFLNAVGVTGVAYHLATLHEKLKITNITQNITVSQETEKDKEQEQTDNTKTDGEDDKTIDVPTTKTDDKTKIDDDKTKTDDEKTNTNDEKDKTDTTPTPSKDTGIRLDAGETAYNESTGVEVTSSGEAYLHEDGQTTVLEQRDLEKDENGLSKVTEEDLKQDATLPQTGEEKTYNEAVGDLSAGELDNLNDAIVNDNQDDFTWYFDEASDLGNSLSK